MLCVTGNEATTDALASRLEQVATRGLPEPYLQEVRLDALQEPLEPVFALLQRHREQIVACNRPVRQGGSFAGSEADRLAQLKRAAGAGVAYLDLEADCAEAELNAVRAGFAGRVVLSWHDFSAVPSDLTRRVEGMGSRGADVLKVAVTVEDAAQLAALLALRERVAQPTVVIGMGLAGIVSRCRYPAFGAPWTYVKADEQSGTAAGQLSLNQALEMGLPQSAEAPFYALMGGPQVQHSMGPVVYNRLFRAWGTPWSYLPVSTADADETFALLRGLGLRGASVTMPHKAWALGKAGEGASDLARRAGAANSLRLSKDGLEATNSDVAGVADPLKEAFARLDGARPERALVLGAGGAARAAVLACRQLELDVIISALEDARELCGTGVRYKPWDERRGIQAEVLINATPISGAKQMPLPEEDLLDKRVVFDLAISGEPSLLLERAAAEGAEPIPAIEMWLAQGAEQMSWITGRVCSAVQLRQLLPG